MQTVHRSSKRLRQNVITQNTQQIRCSISATIQTFRCTDQPDELTELTDLFWASSPHNRIWRSYCAASSSLITGSSFSIISIISVHYKDGYCGIKQPFYVTTDVDVSSAATVPLNGRRMMTFHGKQRVSQVSYHLITLYTFFSFLDLLIEVSFPQFYVRHKFLRLTIFVCSAYSNLKNCQVSK